MGRPPADPNAEPTTLRILQAAEAQFAERKGWIVRVEGTCAAARTDP